MRVSRAATRAGELALEASLRRNEGRALELREAERILRSSAQCGRDWFGLQHTADGSFTWIPFLCGKKFCLRCVRTWSNVLTARLLPRVAGARPQDIRLIVLTIPNAPLGKLGEAYTALRASVRDWRDRGNRKRTGDFLKKARGYAIKIELTISDRTGWHPHVHMLVHARGGIDMRRESKAREAWCRVTANHGYPSNPGANWISAPATSEAAAREVAKYTTKPLDLDLAPLDAIIECATALHKRRFTAAHGTLTPLPPETLRGGAGYVHVGRLSKLVQDYEDTGSTFALRAIRSFAARHQNDRRAREAIPLEVFDL